MNIPGEGRIRTHKLLFHVRIHAISIFDSLLLAEDEFLSQFHFVVRINGVIAHQGRLGVIDTDL